MAESSSDMLTAALALAEAGWSVVPMAPRGKQPLIAWREFQERRAEPDEIRAWFRRWPQANIAVVTGTISGIVVVDIDPRHGGEASLQILEGEVGSIPSTIEAETGGGGRHLYFAHPGQTVRNRTALYPGIDLRGDGGVIVVPPSIHPSGRRYVWLKGHGPDRAEPALLPKPLQDKLVIGRDHSGHPLIYWRELVAAGVGEGERNNTIASLAGHLLWHGVDPDVVAEMMCCWNAVRCRPPLEEAEVLRTVGSIAKTQRRRSGAVGLPPANSRP